MDQRRNRRLPKSTCASFVRRTAVLLAAGIQAVGSNFAPLWYTMHHSKQTIRGGSGTRRRRGNLPGRVGTRLRYGLELRTRRKLEPVDSRTSWAAIRSGVHTRRQGSRGLETVRGLEGIAEQLPAYWGQQPYTAGPTYLGAAALFLALLGLLLASGRNKWWIAAVSLLTLLLAWGHNFMGFTEFAFKYLPGYNKFRTVSMALVVVEWTVPLLAALA